MPAMQYQKLQYITYACPVMLRVVLGAMQITSLFLHWFPACVAWTERWHPEIHASHASGKSPEALKEWDTATVAQLILFPCLPYLLWAILYYIKVDRLLGSRSELQPDCIVGRFW